MGAKTGLYKINPSKESGGKQPFQQNRIYDSNGIIPALQSQISSGSYAIQLDSEIRRLTPLECERLQMFPDLWTQYGLNENNEKVLISDTQRYKCLGNAITVKIAEYVFKNIKSEQQNSL